MVGGGSLLRTHLHVSARSQGPPGFPECIAVGSTTQRNINVLSEASENKQRQE